MAQTYPYKTPLRYPGGKSRAMKFLGDHFPENIKQYNEPFIGGGSVAVWFAQANPNANIWINDLYGNLYNFWIQLRDNCHGLQNEVKAIKDTVTDQKEIGKETFNRIREDINTEGSDEKRAAYFYALNKMSFSGLTENRSSFSHSSQVSNFSYLGIEKMSFYSDLIQKWKITNLDYKDLMVDDAFVFLDPPYEIASSNLYGKDGATHKYFDHDDFAKTCNDCKADQMITYNADQSVKDRFPDWRQIVWDLKYSMCTNSKNYLEQEKDRKELLLMNYDEETNALAKALGL
jgi:DNA adenine methylase Dam